MKKIGEDKVLHFVVCILITAVVGLLVKGLATWYGYDIPNPPIGAVGAIVALIIGAGKEACDYVQKRELDFFDLIADAAGSAVGFLLVQLL